MTPNRTLFDATPKHLAIGDDFTPLTSDEIGAGYVKACRFINAIVHDSHRIEIRRTAARIEHGGVLARGRRRSLLVDPVELFPNGGSEAGRDFFGMLASEAGPTRRNASFELVELALAQPVNGSLLAEDGSPTREATAADVAFCSGVWIEIRNVYGLREGEDASAVERTLAAISPAWVELRTSCLTTYSRFHDLTSFEAWRVIAVDLVSKAARMLEPFRVDGDAPAIAPRTFDPTAAFPIPGLPFLP